MDFLEYKMSFIWNLIPFGSIIFALLDPSIKFVIPDLVLALTFVNINLRKYLLSQKNYVWLHSL